MIKNRKSSIDERTILASELYYLYHLSQEEIAKQLGVSRPWVSKLLTRAEETGIVRIEVMTPTSGITDMEIALEEKFKIKKAKVIKNIPGMDPLVNIGRATANYVISILRPDDVIGVSWGNTLSYVADAFIPLHYPNVKVIPLIGGLGINSKILSNQIAIKIADALGSQYNLIFAPAIAVGKAEKEIFLKDPNIIKSINEGENVDIAILGLGSLRQSTIYQFQYIDAQEIDELEKLGAVGDISLEYIDKTGNKINHRINDRLIAADLMIVRKNAREIIGVAFDKNKVPIIRATLAGNWLDVLITDDATAKELLQ